MKNMRNTFMMTVALVALAACAGDPAVSTVKTEGQKATAEMVQKTIDTTPGWFIDPPKDKDTVYSVGMATSPDLQLSIDKAVLSAKRVLADRVEGRMNSMTKTFITEIGQDNNPSIIREVEQVTKSVLVDVNVAGYEVARKEILPFGTQYRTYVLLSYKTNDANQVLMDRLKSRREIEAAMRASKAFRELDKEVATVRKEDNQARSDLRRAIENPGEESPAPRRDSREPVTTE